MTAITDDVRKKKGFGCFAWMIRVDHRLLALPGAGSEQSKPFVFLILQMGKESHSFSVDVATITGVKEALILQHFLYLQKATIEKGEDWRQKWIRKSNASLLITYTYMTPKEIRGAIDKLLREGYIHCKVDNEDPKDRTKSYLLSESGRAIFESESTEVPFAKRANDKHLPKGQINKSYNGCKSNNEKSLLDIPADEKSAGFRQQNSEAWTKKVATLFDKVSEEEHQSHQVEYEPFNWLAGAGRQFSALKMIRKSLAADIEKKHKRTPTEEELTSGFEYLFRYCFRYLSEVAHQKSGAVQFTPAIVLNNYNNVLQYARQAHSKKGHDANTKRREAVQAIIDSAGSINFD